MYLKRLAVILGAAALAACGSNPYGPSGGGHSRTITVSSNFFTPTPDTVSAGTVTFSWSSGTHNVTWDSGPTAPANSGDKASGTLVVSLTAGTYQYHCTLHGLAGSGMHGTIVVQ
jgi:plastocyanin